MAESVQDHLHLDTDDPPTATYAALRRTPQPSVFLTLERGLDGTLHRHVLSTGGAPKVYNNWVYQLKVSRAELSIVFGLLGKSVYLIDHVHDPDNHAAYSKEVVVREISSVSQDPVSSKAALTYFAANIALEAKEAD